ncbi:MAG TPA: WD40 repeat domain-containing protein [Gemmataceae bacterium]|nr:WD40 repeat domain-containing protein [Gemmataceae bacterium]
MREYTGPKFEIVHVALTGTPARPAAVDREAAYLWDLDRPEPVAELRWDGNAWGQPVLSVSPDGRWLAAGPAEHLFIWNTEDRPPSLRRWLWNNDLCRADFVRPDRLIVIARLSGRLSRYEMWEADEWNPQQDLIDFELTDDLADKVSKLNLADGRRHTALSGDGSRFAFTGWHEKGVTVWDAATGRRLGRIPLKGTTSCLALSPDGSRLAIDGGTTVYVHDATSLELLTRWKTKYCYVPQLAWSPDGRLIGRTDRSTTTRLYDPATGREVSALGTKRGMATAIAFAPDGLTYATGHRDGTVRVWDVG